MSFLYLPSYAGEICQIHRWTPSSKKEQFSFVYLKGIVTTGAIKRLETLIWPSIEMAMQLILSDDLTGEKAPILWERKLQEGVDLSQQKKWFKSSRAFLLITLKIIWFKSWIPNSENREKSLLWHSLPVAILRLKQAIGGEPAVSRSRSRWSSYWTGRWWQTI